MKIKRTSHINGEICIPGDKSISHRAVMLGAIADGTTEITNFLQGADCLSTIQCFRKMGVRIENDGKTIQVHGKGLRGLNAPDSVLDVGNSGTTARLLAGILCGQNFSSELNGDASIQKRPMNRVLNPLTNMGASIVSRYGNDRAPLLINKSELKGIHYDSPVASAQVKSCILLAGLYADGETSVTEPYLSRNHTELMLQYFGAGVHTDQTTASLLPPKKLEAGKIEVPGDISSAAYFMAAAAILPSSGVLIKNVGINPTRNGILTVMKQMGAKITLENEHLLGKEPVADIYVQSSSLRGVTIGGSLIPALIDELPVIAVLAAFAEGETVIRDAQELKVKESDRIAIVTKNLAKMGADVQAAADGMIIRGGRTLKGAEIETCHDHRIAMSFAVAALAAEGETTLLNGECVTISYPEFYNDLNKLCQERV